MRSNPMIRAAGAQAAHESRHLAILIAAVLAFVIVVATPLQRLYDEHLRPRPWISATVEIVPSDSGKPRIRYSVGASTEVGGRWRAWLDVESVRTCFGSGNGNYSPDTPRDVPWAWADWLGHDCAEPVLPYSACVSYAVSTARGAVGDFGPFCSVTYDPRRAK